MSPAECGPCRNKALPAATIFIRISGNCLGHNSLGLFIFSLVDVSIWPSQSEIVTQTGGSINETRVWSTKDSCKRFQSRSLLPGEQRGRGKLGHRNLVGTKTFPLSDSCASMGEMSLTNTVTCKPTSHRYISTKVLLAEGGHSPFTEHCRTYENTFKALQTELQSLKDQVQEMHRDLTKHHSLVKTDAIDEILQKSLQMETQISSQYSSVETMRTMFEEVWEETYQRVANEHEIYEAQLHDLMLLKQENTYLMTIARQISPYIRSIAKVKERLEPRLKEPRDAKDDRTDSMLKIYDESSIMTTDGQHRNDLTCPSEDKEKLTDNKDKVIDNRTLNILPADSELKSRELHRTKQKTGLDSSDRMELTL